MSRSYRRVILAAFGWLILAASPPKGDDAQSEQYQTDRSIAESLRGIDATLKKPAEPDITTQPCADDDDTRTSDLCAQWKAADAASSAALATWLLGTFGSIVGAITMIAAIKAAVYAKKAAEHTEIGANEAKRSADAAERNIVVTQRSLRPYLLPVNPKIDAERYVKYDKELIRPRVTFVIENVGEGVAFLERVVWNLEGGSQDFLNVQTNEGRAIFIKNGSSLEYSSPDYLTLTINDFHNHFTGSTAFNSSINIFLYYRGVFGYIRKTSFGYYRFSGDGGYEYLSNGSVWQDEELENSEHAPKPDSQ